MRVLASILVLSCAALLSCAQVLASPTCPEEQDTKQLPPADPAVCDALDPVVRSPRAANLKDYETNLNQYLDLNCHRRLDKGWKVDKHIRDTGPWTGTYSGTHAPVLVWYSPETYRWVKANRSADGTPSRSAVEPVPDGAMIIQEMYTAPAAACAGIDWEWLKNIKDEPGQPLVFLSENFFLDLSWQSLHIRIIQSAAKGAPPPGEPPYNPAFTKLYWSLGGPPPRSEVGEMPSQTYDNVWVKANEPTAASQYVTSDQCLGCHSAGGTGLQYDMTAPGTDTKLINLSPYGTWRGSP